ncbi:flagellin N-terminal helical domain-containing protein [Paenibacillus sp. UNC451MF]|uniref:flagellin N-terminal helical domain-containing protein n=1 Tax=Paenibacillus sp. UNC451MF TaxID=1449063 RepID=UPI0004910289|nr:flagellin [Paenibacillus sp. UNC451MF]
MIINHNMNALNTHRQMGTNNVAAGKNMEKLSSGLRINRAADDAAGLSISEKMRGQIRSMEQAQRNAQDGISMVQTAEGALTEVSDMLVRIKELYTQKANGTYNTTDKANIDEELKALKSEITNIGTNTKFNDIALLDGTLSKDIQINHTSSDTLKIALSEDVSGVGTAASDLDNATKQIDKVAKARAQLGALQNRLEHTSNNLGTTTENLTAAESRIRDTDMAKEMVNLTKNNILLQASQAMLAQANQQPQGVLSLLR